MTYNVFGGTLNLNQSRHKAEILYLRLVLRVEQYYLGGFQLLISQGVDGNTDLGNHITHQRK